MATHTVLSPSPLHTPGAADAVMTQCWMLTPGRALHFHADQAVQMQVTQGRVWATLDGPHTGAPNDLGDLFMQAGARLTLHPGQRLLVESWSGKGLETTSRLVWTPVPKTAQLSAWREAASALAAWFAEAGRLGRLGLKRGLQCQTGPGCHGVG